MHTVSDIVIVGGGIAGVSAAYFISAHASVVLLETEEFIGTHSSARSCEQFTVGIGAATMRRMAQASRCFFEHPPAGFATAPLVFPRGCLTVGRVGQEQTLQRIRADITSVGAEARLVERDEALALFPLLRADNVDAGIYEPGAMDIDSSQLLQAFARGARARGAKILTRAAVTAMERKAGYWQVKTTAGSASAPLLLNAGGAWGDRITALAGLPPLGLVPYRRTAFTFATPPDRDAARWPHVSNVDYRWYVQPGRHGMLGSLAEAVPTEPGDVYPDDIDVAQAVDNIERETRLRIGKPTGAWAGLRSFVADRNPVCGTRDDAEGFHWLVGQGGCGILTAPAMGQAIAALVRGDPLPQAQRDLGVSAADLAPGREALIAGLT